MKTTVQDLRELLDDTVASAPVTGTAQPDALGPLRALLAALDASAYDARGPLNVMVKNATALSVAAEGIESAGSAELVKAKTLAGRVLTSYAELVSMLAKAQASVGYSPSGPSVVGEAPEEAPAS